MTKDQKLAELMAACLSDLKADTPAGDARAVEALRQIEAVAPGELRAMAENLRKLPLSQATAH